MTLASKSISDLNDLRRIHQFTLQNSEICFHVADLPDRLCSPAAQDFYEVVGFREVSHVVKYFRRF